LLILSKFPIKLSHGRKRGSLRGEDLDRRVVNGQHVHPTAHHSRGCGEVAEGQGEAGEHAAAENFLPPFGPG